MGKKTSLSLTKRAKIITLFNDAKLCKREIARRQNVAESTVRLTISKYNAAGPYRDARRSGRPPKLTVRDRRGILRAVESNRRLSSCELRDEVAIGGVGAVHASTIRRFLIRAGFRGRIAVRKPFINEVNRKKRLEKCTCA